MLNLSDSPITPTEVPPTAQAVQAKDAALFGDSGAIRHLTTRQRFFVRLVESGKNHSEAYRVAYCKPNAKGPAICNAAYKVATNPKVAACLDAIKFDGIAPRLITLEERLRLVAAIFMSPNSTRHERLRAVEVYTKIAGDGAPELPVDPTGKNLDDTALNITVNVFQNAPSRVRAVTPIQARNVTPASNGNGNGHH